ncbi:MAG TPA: hypothetical protein PLD27_03040 [bacterium]|nr:hypothetical protein [bacterium]HOL47050.1 hypothetical protein [bacterium]HPQ17945.1 hypothetical protein [bacterium]
MKKILNILKFILSKLFFYIKKFYSKLIGREVKVINLDKDGQYKKIKIKKSKPLYKEWYGHQPMIRTAIFILFLFIFLFFLYLFWGTWDIPRWLFGRSKFDFNYNEQEFQK